MKKLLAILSVVLFASPASARCAKDHMAIGWEPIWEGVTTVLNCGPEIEPMQFGIYPLRCHKEDYYPNYNGHAVLLKGTYEFPKRFIYSYTLCLTSLGDDYPNGLTVEIINMPSVVEKE